ncbi:hypothetical protein [Chamaesiphon sp.]|uniref:hypothetical protein n=1 Tax=Chamaesiphon sp. TaxID=2814140 RepID=UPI0035947DBB
MIWRNLFLAILFTSSYLSLPVRAETGDIQSGEQLAGVQKALSQATFANSPPTTASVTYTANPLVPQIPSFSYTAGTPLTQAIPGALASIMGASKYSPQSAIIESGGDLSALTNANLTALPFVGKLPFASIVSANPQIAGLKVGDVFPSWGAVDPSKSVADVASGLLGKIPLPMDVLGNTPTLNLPGIIGTPYGEYPGIGKLPLDGFNIDGLDTVLVSDLPGIPDLSWDKFIKIDVIPSFMVSMKFDLLHSGQKELNLGKGDKVFAGSNKEPNAPCKNCDAVELLSAIAPNSDLNPYNGTISPIGLRLKGGEGLLGELTTAAGMREPSGFEIPYIGINNCGSKWSAESPNVKNGTIQQTLNFRICYDVLFLGRQATPYFLPLPLPLPANEKQANFLLPMSIKPVASKLLPLPTLPTLPSVPTLPSLPSVPTLPSSPPQLFVSLPTTETPSAAYTIPSTIGYDRIALFGAATKNSYSPILNILSTASN